MVMRGMDLAKRLIAQNGTPKSLLTEHDLITGIASVREDDPRSAILDKPLHHEISIGVLCHSPGRDLSRVIDPEDITHLHSQGNGGAFRGNEVQIIKIQMHTMMQDKSRAGRAPRAKGEFPVEHGDQIEVRGRCFGIRDSLQEGRADCTMLALKHFHLFLIGVHVRGRRTGRGGRGKFRRL